MTKRFASCENYTANGNETEEQSCASYCCGTCKDRYCCEEVSLRLDQKACVAENCTANYDFWGLYQYPIDCYGLFCCGSCEYRYCCSNPNLKFNQSKCTTQPTSTISTTRRTTTTYYYFNNNSSIYAVYWAVGSLTALFILSFISICCLWSFARQQRRHRQEQQLVSNYINYNNNLIHPIGRPQYNGYPSDNRNIEYPRQPASNIYNGFRPANNTQRSAFVIADNSAYNYDMNKIYNTNINDDLPPSYDTVNIKPKKADETIETNL